MKRKNNDAWQNSFVYAFLLTLIINTPLVFMTAFARESRLFALPLLFIWPMFMQLFGSDLKPLFVKKNIPRAFQKQENSISVWSPYFGEFSILFRVLS
ncbi:hypothetical protein ACU8V7_01325 [Zobellia nedashkovskayae]